MLTNLHLRSLIWVGLAGLFLDQPPCPPESGRLVTTGWSAYRADSMPAALQRFARADSLCPTNLDAKIGLGNVRLRQGRLGAADSLFSVVAAADSGNGDAWDGLALTRYRAGNTVGALAAAHRAIRRHPDNAATRRILDALEPGWERDTAAAPVPPPGTALRVEARVRGNFFEVPGRLGFWRKFYVNGVNMGAALPGKFPSEFPPDSSTYAGWFATLSAMHANTLRVYTILPPSFYRALRGWNLTHRSRPLWLVHGVWTELPAGHDFNDRAWKAGFREEMRRVVDLLHGGARLPIRPGHAGGVYDADVSAWTLAYIIGREWEPYAVKAFEAGFSTPSPGYAGRYLATTGGLHSDAWMAEECDYMLEYEAGKWRTIRPIAYTNWPTLDPLTHPTEPTAAEEAAWRKRVGRPIAREPIEYENDVIGLDAMTTRATDRNPAGWFASYHAYPYYPDFLLYDPGYDSARSREGRSNYFGYLTSLKRHHAGIPLLLSEYGVPSSRGMAHLQPQGWHHGGHDEVAMARIDARLTREIRESGAAGGIIFAWIDEWFKKNWLVIDYEIPRENTRRWHNMMDAEQNYGILGMYAGDAGTSPVLGGTPLGWRKLTPVATVARAATPGGPTALRAGQDASYVYLSAEFPAYAGKDFPWATRDVILALDTHRADLGQRTLPSKVLTGDVGFEFVAVFRSRDDAELRITPEYNPYVNGDAIVNGDDYGRFANRPVTIRTREDGRFDSLFAITNRARFARDGRFFPAGGVNRGRLRYGTEAGSSLSDWYWDQATGQLQVRLAWNLLNVSDPSSRTLLYEKTFRGDTIGTRKSDGFRIGLAVTREENGRRSLEAALPRTAPDGRWRRQDFRTWEWPAWDEPRYHQRLKPVYDSLKTLWGGWR